MGAVLIGHLVEIAKLFVYAVCGAIIMGVALGIFLRLLQRITPINEWEELKKGNIAVAIYFGLAVLALGLTIMASILPSTRKLSPDPLRVVVEQKVQQVAPAQNDNTVKGLKKLVK